MSLYQLVKKRYGSSYEKIHDNGAVCDVDADISTDRNRIAVLSSSVLVINNQAMVQCPYQSFFESHILPYRVEKKIVRLLKRGVYCMGRTRLLKTDVALLLGVCTISQIPKMPSSSIMHPYTEMNIRITRLEGNCLVCLDA